MATHDYSIANATGAAFRADLNSALLAIASTNSSSVEPAVPYAGMLWTDLSTGADGTVRRRNGANTAWLTDVGIDSVARSAAAAAQATADAALPKAGGTMTGAIVLPASDPTGTQAVSKAYADATYNLKLLTPVAGSLLLGTAGGWLAKLDPGSANALLSVVGGLPTWQLTAQTASPNSVVRTGPDGTIDASFVPAVASGLKYRGTFKPAVNAEYPTTGGTGAGGVPAIGDFWVVDGLTTGGYTYLTGSLAGVTVYNGDSIAFNGTVWYRMGSSVALQGYMKLDGSTAMAGALDMGTNPIANVGNITARSGTPPLVSGFQFDATNIFLSPQRGTTGPDLAVMPTGQLGTDLGRMQIFVGASGSNVALVPVTFFSETANYATSSYVYNAADGYAYRAAQAITAGAFNAANWRRVVDTSGATFVGGVTFNASPTIGVGQILRILRSDATLAASISASATGSQLNFTTYDAAGANPYSPIAVRGAPYLDVGITKLYVDGQSVFNNAINLRIGGGSNAIMFMENATVARYYVTGDSNYLNFNVLNDAQGYLGTPLRIARSNTEFQVQTRGGLRVWGFQGNDGLGVIYFGADNNVQQYWSGAQFIFSHTCVAPAFTPSCDIRVKRDIREAAASDFGGVTFKTFYRTDNERNARGVIAQDFLARWPEYVTPAELPDGEERLGLDIAGIALELAFNLRDRVDALEAAATPPAPTET